GCAIGSCAKRIVGYRIGPSSWGASQPKLLSNICAVLNIEICLQFANPLVHPFKEVIKLPQRNKVKFLNRVLTSEHSQIDALSDIIEKREVSSPRIVNNI